MECSFVVRWWRLRSASRANCLLQPLILHGQTPVTTTFLRGTRLGAGGGGSDMGRANIDVCNPIMNTPISNSA